MRHKRFFRIVTYLVIAVFLYQDTIWAQGMHTQISSQQIQLQSTFQTDQLQSIIKSLVIPEQIGKIKSIYEEPMGNDKVILHIQDSHANYEAQMNIAKILEYIATLDNYSKRPLLIAVEGAKNKVDTTILNSIKSKNIRYMISNYLLENALIDGAEFYSGMQEQEEASNILMWGMEDKEVYIRNRNLFKKLYEIKPGVKKVIRKFRLGLLSKIRKVFNPEQLVFIKKLKAYHSDIIGLEEYARHLYSNLKSSNAWINFSRLIQMVKLKEGIDFSKVEEERMLLIKDLRTICTKEELSEVITHGLEYQIGKLTAKDYFAYLGRYIENMLLDEKTKARSWKYNGISIKDEYKNLVDYIDYVKIESQIDRDVLFQELNQIEKVVAQDLFNSGEDMECYLQIKHLIIIEKFIELKIYREDLRYYKENKREFMAMGGMLLHKFLIAFEKFCSLGIKRDNILMENTLKKMDELGTNTAVLITGGFHTEGITSLFRKRGISHIVISPRMTELHTKDRYTDLMLGKKSTLDKILMFTGTRIDLATNLVPNPGDVLGDPTDVKLVEGEITKAKEVLEKFESLKQQGGEDNVYPIEGFDICYKEYFPEESDREKKLFKELDGDIVVVAKSGQSDRIMPIEKNKIVAKIKTIFRIIAGILPKNPPITPAIRKAWVNVRDVLATASYRLYVQKILSVIAEIVVADYVKQWIPRVKRLLIEERGALGFGGGEESWEDECFNRFKEYWDKEFAAKGKRNIYHGIVNGLVYAGEMYKKDIRVRIYPNLKGEKGVIGVLKVGKDKTLVVNYNVSSKKIEKTDITEDEIIQQVGKEYDWEWIEERFTLNKIRKFLSSGKALERVKNLREIYEGYIELLGIRDEEEKNLRSNLATASYWCVIKNKQPDKVIDIYLRELGLSKEGLKEMGLAKDVLKLKKQLIIATYEVAMKGKEGSLREVIKLYKPYVEGRLGDKDILIKWLIATYDVAMNGKEGSLGKVIESYKPYVEGRLGDKDILNQWLIATYAIAMRGKEGSLGKVIELYKPYVEGRLGDKDILIKWLIATYEVAMNGKEGSLGGILILLGKEEIFSKASQIIGDILVITSYLVQLPDSMEKTKEFVELINDNYSKEGLTRIVKEYSNSLYQDLTGRSVNKSEDKRGKKAGLNRRKFLKGIVGIGGLVFIESNLPGCGAGGEKEVIGGEMLAGDDSKWAYFEDMSSDPKWKSMAYEFDELIDFGQYKSLLFNNIRGNYDGLKIRIQLRDIFTEPDSNAGLYDETFSLSTDAERIEIPLENFKGEEIDLKQIKAIVIRYCKEAGGSSLNNDNSGEVYLDGVYGMGAAEETIAKLIRDTRRDFIKQLFGFIGVVAVMFSTLGMADAGQDVIFSSFNWLLVGAIAVFVGATLLGVCVYIFAAKWIFTRGVDSLAGGVLWLGSRFKIRVKMVIVILTACSTLFSCFGQLYNEIKDEIERRAMYEKRSNKEIFNDYFSEIQKYKDLSLSEEYDTGTDKMLKALQDLIFYNADFRKQFDEFNILRDYQNLANFITRIKEMDNTELLQYYINKNYLDDIHASGFTITRPFYNFPISTQNELEEAGVVRVTHYERAYTVYKIIADIFWTRSYILHVIKGEIIIEPREGLLNRGIIFREKEKLVYSLFDSEGTIYDDGKGQEVELGTDVGNITKKSLIWKWELSSNETVQWYKYLGVKELGINLFNDYENNILRFTTAGRQVSSFNFILVDGKGQQVEIPATEKIETARKDGYFTEQYIFVHLKDIIELNPQFSWENVVKMIAKANSVKGEVTISELDFYNVKDLQESGVILGVFQDNNFTPIPDWYGKKPQIVHSFVDIVESSESQLKKWQELSVSGQIPMSTLEFWVMFGAKGWDQIEREKEEFIKLYGKGLYDMIIELQSVATPGALGEKPVNRIFKAIKEGKFDVLLRKRARTIKEYGKHILERPLHEFTGFWYPWEIMNEEDIKNFIEAWIYIYNLYQEEGAHNALFVWSPHQKSVLGYRKIEEMLQKLYPYIDVIALDGYGNYDGPFREIFTGLGRRLAKYGIPIIIGEFGTTPVEGKPGYKEKFFAEMNEFVRNTGIYMGVVYFDETKEELGEKGMKSFNPMPGQVRGFHQDNFYGRGSAEKLAQYSGKRRDELKEKVEFISEYKKLQTKVVTKEDTPEVPKTVVTAEQRGNITHEPVINGNIIKPDKQDNNLHLFKKGRNLTSEKAKKEWKWEPVVFDKPLDTSNFKEIVVVAKGKNGGERLALYAKRYDQPPYSVPDSYMLPPLTKEYQEYHIPIKIDSPIVELGLYYAHMALINLTVNHDIDVWIDVKDIYLVLRKTALLNIFNSLSSNMLFIILLPVLFSLTGCFGIRDSIAGISLGMAEFISILYSIKEFMLLYPQIFIVLLTIVYLFWRLYVVNFKSVPIVPETNIVSRSLYKIRALINGRGWEIKRLSKEADETIIGLYGERDIQHINLPLIYWIIFMLSTLVFVGVWLFPFESNRIAILIKLCITIFVLPILVYTGKLQFLETMNILTSYKTLQGLVHEFVNEATRLMYILEREPPDKQQEYSKLIAVPPYMVIGQNTLSKLFLKGLTKSTFYQDKQLLRQISDLKHWIEYMKKVRKRYFANQYESVKFISRFSEALRVALSLDMGTKRARMFLKELKKAPQLINRELIFQLENVVECSTLILMEWSQKMEKDELWQICFPFMPDKIEVMDKYFLPLVDLMCYMVKTVTKIKDELSQSEANMKKNKYERKNGGHRPGGKIFSLIICSVSINLLLDIKDVFASTIQQMPMLSNTGAIFSVLGQQSANSDPLVKIIEFFYYNPIAIWPVLFVVIAVGWLFWKDHVVETKQTPVVPEINIAERLLHRISVLIMGKKWEIKRVKEEIEETLEILNGKKDIRKTSFPIILGIILVFSIAILFGIWKYPIGSLEGVWVRVMVTLLILPVLVYTGKGHLLETIRIIRPSAYSSLNGLAGTFASESAKLIVNLKDLLHSKTPDFYPFNILIVPKLLSRTLLEGIIYPTTYDDKKLLQTFSHLEEWIKYMKETRMDYFHNEYENTDIKTDYSEAVKTAILLSLGIKKAKLFLKQLKKVIYIDSETKDKIITMLQKEIEQSVDILTQWLKEIESPIKLREDDQYGTHFPFIPQKTEIISKGLIKLQEQLNALKSTINEIKDKLDKGQVRKTGSGKETNTKNKIDRRDFFSTLKKGIVGGLAYFYLNKVAEAKYLFPEGPYPISAPKKVTKMIRDLRNEINQLYESEIIQTPEGPKFKSGAEMAFTIAYFSIITLFFSERMEIILKDCDEDLKIKVNNAMRSVSDPYLFGKLMFGEVLPVYFSKYGYAFKMYYTDNLPCLDIRKVLKVREFIDNRERIKLVLLENNELRNLFDLHKGFADPEMYYEEPPYVFLRKEKMGGVNFEEIRPLIRRQVLDKYKRKTILSIIRFSILGAIGIVVGWFIYRRDKLSQEGKTKYKKLKHVEFNNKTKKVIANVLKIAFISVVILTIIIPFFHEFYMGQFYGVSNWKAPIIPGGDFLIYNRGPLAYFDHGIDPYSNKDTKELWGQGLLSTHHPNENIDKIGIKDVSGGEIGQGHSIGYIASPFNLLLFYPLSHFTSYLFALNFWFVLSLLAFGLSVAIFTIRFSDRSAPKWQKWLNILFVACIFFRSFMMRSMLIGQIDAIYFLLLSLSILLFASYRKNLLAIITSSILLGAATGIKIFPGVLIIYFLLKSVANIIRDKKEGDFSIKNIIRDKTNIMSLFSIINVLFLICITFCFVDLSVVGSWFSKMRVGKEVFTSITELRPSFLQYLRIIPYWFNPFRDDVSSLYVASGSFSAIIYAIVAVVLIYIFIKNIRLSDNRKVLLEISFLISILPTIMPHWWDIYNIMLIIPFMTAYYYSKRVEDQNTKKLVHALLFISFICVGGIYLLYHVIPGSGEWFTNMKLVNMITVGMSQESKVDFFGKIFSPHNLLIGWPGSFILAIAVFILLRWHNRKTDYLDNLVASVADKKGKVRKGILKEILDGRQYLTISQLEQLDSELLTKRQKKILLELKTELEKKNFYDNIGKVRYAVFEDKIVVFFEDGTSESLDINQYKISTERIDKIIQLAKKLCIYSEFKDEFINMFNNIKVMVFTGTSESRARGAFAHMGEDEILYIDSVLLNNDMAIIHEVLHLYLRTTFGDNSEVLRQLIIDSGIDKRQRKKILEKAGDNSAYLRHYYTRYYLQNPKGGEYKGSVNEGLTNEIRREMAVNMFTRYWEENFAGKGRRNYMHTMINGLIYAGELYKKDIKIRIYPDPDNGEGIIGILRTGRDVILSVRYTKASGIGIYDKNEKELKERVGKEYDWDWVEERFSLDKIRGILSSGKGLSRVVNVKEIYEKYIKELGITKEEEKKLRSNLATASYWCVIKNKQPYKVIDIYLRELGLSKEGLKGRGLSKDVLKLKKQLIIATYEVAMNGKTEPFLFNNLDEDNATLKEIMERKGWEEIILTHPLVSDEGEYSFLIIPLIRTGERILSGHITEVKIVTYTKEVFIRNQCLRYHLTDKNRDKNAMTLEIRDDQAILTIGNTPTGESTPASIAVAKDEHGIDGQWHKLRQGETSLVEVQSDGTIDFTIYDLFNNNGLGDPNISIGFHGVVIADTKKVVSLNRSPFVVDIGRISSKVSPYVELTSKREYIKLTDNQDGYSYSGNVQDLNQALDVFLAFYKELSIEFNSFSKSGVFHERIYPEPHLLLDEKREKPLELISHSDLLEQTQVKINFMLNLNDSIPEGILLKVLTEKGIAKQLEDGKYLIGSIVYTSGSGFKLTGVGDKGYTLPYLQFMVNVSEIENLFKNYYLSYENMFSEYFKGPFHMEIRFRDYSFSLPGAELDVFIKINPEPKLLTGYSDGIAGFTRRGFIKTLLIAIGALPYIYNCAGREGTGEGEIEGTEETSTSEEEETTSAEDVEESLDKLVNWLMNNKNQETKIPKSFQVLTSDAENVWNEIEYIEGERQDPVEAIIERMIVGVGASWYDIAVSVIALISAGRNPQEITNALLKALEDQRLKQIELVARYEENDPEHPFQPEGLFFRLFPANGEYLQEDPIYGKTYEGYPNNPNIHWEDWKPIAGENAWIVLMLLHLFDSTGDERALNLAKQIASALMKLQADNGGIRMAPIGTYHPQGNDFYYNEISTENNLSSYAAFRMLYKITGEREYYDVLQGIESYLDSAFNREENIFWQGMHYYDSAGWTTDYNQIFAVDCQTWGIGVLGPEKIDTWFGDGTAYKIWQKTKELARFDQKGAVGFSEDDVVSVEWTGGAILAVNKLIKHYSQYSEELSKDIDTMNTTIKKLLKVINDNESAYPYADKRIKIPFGWNSPPEKVLSTTSTGWRVFNLIGLDPFIEEEIIPPEEEEEGEEELKLAGDDSEWGRYSGSNWASMAVEFPAKDLMQYGYLLLEGIRSKEGSLNVMVQLRNSQTSPDSNAGLSSDIYTISETATDLVIPLSKFKNINLNDVTAIAIHYGKTAWNISLNPDNNGVVYLDDGAYAAEEAEATVATASIRNQTSEEDEDKILHIINPAAEGLFGYRYPEFDRYRYPIFEIIADNRGKDVYAILGKIKRISPSGLKYILDSIIKNKSLHEVYSKILYDPKIKYKEHDAIVKLTLDIIASRDLTILEKQLLVYIFDKLLILPLKHKPWQTDRSKRIKPNDEDIKAYGIWKESKTRRDFFKGIISPNVIRSMIFTPIFLLGFSLYTNAAIDGGIAGFDWLGLAGVIALAVVVIAVFFFKPRKAFGLADERVRDGVSRRDFLNIVGLGALGLWVEGLFGLNPIDAISEVKKSKVSSLGLDIEKAYLWAKRQIKPHTNLINSFVGLPDKDPSSGVTWMYNQAQAIQVFLAVEDIDTAERLARGLLRLERKDGAWYNAYMTDSGEIALKLPEQNGCWVGPNMAIGHALLNLLEQTNDKELAKKTLDASIGLTKWLDDLTHLRGKDGEHVNYNSANKEQYQQSKYAYVSVGRNEGDRYHREVWTEHNMRVFALYYQVYNQFKDKKHKHKKLLANYKIDVSDYKIRADKIIAWIQADVKDGGMWDSEEKHYIMGYKDAEIKGDFPKIFKHLLPGEFDYWNRYMWGYPQYLGPIMAHIAGLNLKDFARGLDWLLKHTSTVTINGKEYTGLPRWLGSVSIHAKGTGEMAAALKLVGRNKEAEPFREALGALQTESGGILAAVGDPKCIWPVHFPYEGIEGLNPFIMGKGPFDARFIARGLTEKGIYNRRGVLIKFITAGIASLVFVVVLPGMLYAWDGMSAPKGDIITKIIQYLTENPVIGIGFLLMIILLEVTILVFSTYLLYKVHKDKMPISEQLPQSFVNFRTFIMGKKWEIRRLRQSANETLEVLTGKASTKYIRFSARIAMIFVLSGLFILFAWSINSNPPIIATVIHWAITLLFGLLFIYTGWVHLLETINNIKQSPYKTWEGLATAFAEEVDQISYLLDLVQAFPQTTYNLFDGNRNTPPRIMFEEIKWRDLFSIGIDPDIDNKTLSWKILCIRKWIKMLMDVQKDDRRYQKTEQTKLFSTLKSAILLSAGIQRAKIFLEELKQVQIIEIEWKRRMMDRLEKAINESAAIIEAWIKEIDQTKSSSQLSLGKIEITDRHADILQKQLNRLKSTVEEIIAELTEKGPPSKTHVGLNRRGFFKGFVGLISGLVLLNLRAREDVWADGRGESIPEYKFPTELPIQEVPEYLKEIISDINGELTNFYNTTIHVTKDGPKFRIIKQGKMVILNPSQFNALVSKFPERIANKITKRVLNDSVSKGWMTEEEKNEFLEKAKDSKRAEITGELIYKFLPEYFSRYGYSFSFRGIYYRNYMIPVIGIRKVNSIQELNERSFVSIKLIHGFVVELDKNEVMSLIDISREFPSAPVFDTEPYTNYVFYRADVLRGTVLQLIKEYLKTLDMNINEIKQDKSFRRGNYPNPIEYAFVSLLHKSLKPLLISDHSYKNVFNTLKTMMINVSINHESMHVDDGINNWVDKSTPWFDTVIEIRGGFSQLIKSQYPHFSLSVLLSSLLFLKTEDKYFIIDRIMFHLFKDRELQKNTGITLPRVENEANIEFFIELPKDIQDEIYYQLYKLKGEDIVKLANKAFNDQDLLTEFLEKMRARSTESRKTQVSPPQVTKKDTQKVEYKKEKQINIWPMVLVIGLVVVSLGLGWIIYRRIKLSKTKEKLAKDKRSKGKGPRKKGRHKGLGLKGILASILTPSSIPVSASSANAVIDGGIAGFDWLGIAGVVALAVVVIAVLFFKPGKVFAFAESKSVILVVDDEEMIRDILAELLQEEGYIVETASNGQKALGLLYVNPERYVLVISDYNYNTPDMMGIDFVMAVRQKLKIAKERLPVMLMSGGDFNDLQAKLGDVKEEVVEVLEKPLNIVNLLELVQRYVPQSLSNQEKNIDGITPLVEELFPGLKDKPRLLGLVAGVLKEPGLQGFIGFYKGKVGIGEAFALLLSSRLPTIVFLALVNFNMTVFWILWGWVIANAVLFGWWAHGKGQAKEQVVFRFLAGILFNLVAISTYALITVPNITSIIIYWFIMGWIAISAWYNIRRGSNEGIEERKKFGIITMALVFLGGFTPLIPYTYPILALILNIAIHGVVWNQIASWLGLPLMMAMGKKINIKELAGKMKVSEEAPKEKKERQLPVPRLLNKIAAGMIEGYKKHNSNAERDYGFGEGKSNAILEFLTSEQVVSLYRIGLSLDERIEGIYYLYNLGTGESLNTHEKETLNSYLSARGREKISRQLEDIRNLKPIIYDSAIFSSLTDRMKKGLRLNFDVFRLHGISSGVLPLVVQTSDGDDIKKLFKELGLEVDEFSSHIIRFTSIKGEDGMIDSGKLRKGLQNRIKELTHKETIVLDNSYILTIPGHEGIWKKLSEYAAVLVIGQGVRSIGRESNLGTIQELIEVSRAMGWDVETIKDSIRKLLGIELPKGEVDRLMKEIEEKDYRKKATEGKRAVEGLENQEEGTVTQL